MEILGFLGRQHDGAGAKSVTEGVELGNRFSLGSFGAGRLLCVEAIGLDLLDGSHIFFLDNPTQLGASAAELTVISPDATGLHWAELLPSSFTIARHEPGFGRR